METLLPLLIGIALLHFGHLYFPQAVSDCVAKKLSWIAKKTGHLAATQKERAVVSWVILPSLIFMLCLFWFTFIALGLLHFIAATVTVMWVLSAYRDTHVETQTESQSLLQMKNELSTWFWVLIFGPAGALASLLLYYFAKDESLSAEHQQVFKRAEVLWQWLPARVIALSFALSGHFVKTISIWRDLALNPTLSAESIIAPCLHSAAGDEGSAQALQDCMLRTRMIWLAAIIIMLFAQFL